MSILNKTFQTKFGYFLVASLFVTSLVALFVTSPMLFAEEDKHSHESELHDKHDHDKHNKEKAEAHEAESSEDDDHSHKDESSKEDDHDHEKDHKNESKKEGSHKENKRKVDDHKEDDHGYQHGESDKKEHTGVSLTNEQIKQAGIQVFQIKKQSVSKPVTALGEVKLNQYKTIKVSSIITTRIETRHVRLGDHVKKGDLLVTLHTISTPDMSANQSADRLSRAELNASITTTIAEMEANIAGAEGDLAAATATWNRIRSLGKDAVSGKRYTAAKIAREQSVVKLNAYKRSRSKIKKIGKPERTKSFAKKHYLLRAEQGGVIIKDDFVLGQIVDSEDVLFVISDMNNLWVEANMKPDDVAKIKVGASASVKAGEKNLKGKVINIGRILDEKTRTLAVRLELHKADSSLFPGQYVNTNIHSNSNRQAIVVPAESVLRGPDGDWMLFVKVAPGKFEPKEVDIKENMGDTVVVSGIEDGVSIVSKGAFTLQSELAKSGFEVHNH